MSFTFQSTLISQKNNISDEQLVGQKLKQHSLRKSSSKSCVVVNFISKHKNSLL